MQAPDLLPRVHGWLERPSWHLRFPSSLEDRFEADTAGTRRHWLFRCGMVGLAIFNVFFLTDRTMVPDVQVFAEIIRLAIVTPVVLILLLSLKLRHSPFLRELFQTVMPMVTLGGILAILLRSQHPNAGYCLVGIVYVVIYALNVARLRFPFALVLAAFTGASSIFLVQVIPSLPASTHSFQLGAILAGLALGLFANHDQEQSERRSYLLNLSEKLRQIDLTRDNAALSVLAETDPLTGLANRRHFDKALDAMLLGEGGVIMLDIDHFKAYNDHYGHPAGDACLQSLATCLRQNVREGDLVARLGGEEFAVLLPDTQFEQAITVVERLFEAIRSLAIPHADSPTSLHVTLSAGLAFRHPEESSSSLMARADTALYGTKTGGRNGWKIAATTHAADLPPRSASTLAT
ncbi:MAG: hypothetical protein RL318_1588 [Fibrobacterota bacterium]